MEPVVPGILHDEKDGNLVGHLEQRREGYTIIHTKEDGDRVEKPNLGQLNGNMADEDEGGAIELLAP